MAQVAPPNPDLPVDTSPEQPYKQSIAPLIVLASALVGVGFYFAVERSEATIKFDSKPFTQLAPVLDMPQPLVEAPLSAPLVLDWSAPTTRTYHMKQVGTRSVDNTTSEPATTEVVFDVAQKSPEGKTVSMALSNTRVQLLQGKENKYVGADIAAQIQNVLNKGRGKLTVAVTKKPAHFRWTSSSNPQLRPTLRIAADALEILVPRFKQGGLKAGDSWSYDLPWAGKQDASIKTDATLRFEHTYKGQTTQQGQRFIVLDTKVSSSGTLNVDNVKATIKGQGRGIVLLGITDKPGHVVLNQFAFVLDQTTSTKNAIQKTQMTFALQPSKSTAPKVGKK